MAAKKFDFRAICAGGTLCRRCRNREGGRKDRQLYQLHYEGCPQGDPDFECPSGRQWIPDGDARLTIGMSVYDDYEGVWATVTGLQAAHPECAHLVDILVVDNNPDSLAGQITASFCKNAGVRYVPFTLKRGTSVREQVFRESKTRWTMCIDSHVILQAGALSSAIEWLAANDGPDLLQGPMIGPGGRISTHMEPKWRARFFGTWEYDPRALDGQPFEIPMQGLGLFACRTDAFPGFNPRFRGWGGEEGYLHQKIRRAGGRTICHPKVRWFHRDRDERLVTPFPAGTADLIRNYLIGWLEVGWPIEDVRREFAGAVTDQEFQQLVEDARACRRAAPTPENLASFLEIAATRRQVSLPVIQARRSACAPCQYRCEDADGSFCGAGCGCSVGQPSQAGGAFGKLVQAVAGPADLTVWEELPGLPLCQHPGRKDGQGWPP